VRCAPRRFSAHGKQPAIKNIGSTPIFSHRQDVERNMRQLLLILILFLVRPASGATAQITNIETVDSTDTETLAPMGASQAILLGIVEGVTEFLPISSTAHLFLVTDLLGLDREEPLLNDDDNPIWYRKPKPGDPGKLLTPNLANQAYIIVVQFGAIAAIIPICWSQFVLMWRGVIRRQDPRGKRLFVNLVVAFVPTAAIGLLVHDWIDENLFSKGAIASALVVGSLLMFAADRWGRSLQAAGRSRELTPHGAAWIGLFQCLAMWPGVGRPMMTIVGGYLAGLPPAPAAGFSFLLGFATVSAATLYKSLKSGPLIVHIFGWQSLAFGIVVAGITAWFSVRFFIKLLLEKGLAPFAWYRLVLAAAILLSS
jgi:undecaprenyl-diphosphatase